MVIRIQPAVGDPEAARALVEPAGRLPDCELLPPVTDSARLLDGLAEQAAESVDALPEIVLVHELIGPMGALELVREIAVRFPAVAVVLITRDTGAPLYSAAMDAGARGIVAAPVHHDELAARVGAAASWAAGVRRHLGGSGPSAAGGGALVAVAGAKGGVGTTLTAVQMALAAQASGRETALVDMDLQSGDVASCLDVQFRRSVADLAGIRDVSPRVLQDAVYVHETGLGLLLAPGDGERGEEVDDRAARQILGALRKRYDVVVVDCGTQMNAANAAAVETADTAVLITTPDVVAVRAAKRMVRLWDRLQVRKAAEVTTLVNRASRSTEIQPALIARIVGTPVARSTVPANFKELHTALDAGRLQDLDNRSSVKQAMWGLAGELGLLADAREAAPGTEPVPARGGRSGRSSRLGRSRPKQDKRDGDGIAGPGFPPAPGGMNALRGPDRRQALPPGASGPPPQGRFGPDRGALSFGRAGRQARGADDDPERTGERGAVTVEFAGLAPVVLVVLAILWQCVLIGYTFTLAGNAADEAARAAAVAAAEGDPYEACEAAATQHLPAAWKAEASVDCGLAGHLWTADVDLTTPLLFPGAAHLPFTVDGSAGAAEEG